MNRPKGFEGSCCGEGDNFGNEGQNADKSEPRVTLGKGETERSERGPAFDGNSNAWSLSDL